MVFFRIFLWVFFCILSLTSRLSYDVIYLSKHVFFLISSNKGYRFMVFNNNTSQPSQTSLFESPLYERSYEGHKVCMRFRYLIYGPGRHFLRIYQQLNLTDYPRRLMWAVNESNNIDMIWKYGRVALPSVTKHKVMKNKSLHNLFSLYILFSQWKSQRNLVHKTRQNVKESVLWSIITWPKLRKQNIQAKEDYYTDWFTFCSENENILVL